MFSYSVQHVLIPLLLFPLKDEIYLLSFEFIYSEKQVWGRIMMANRQYRGLTLDVWIQ